MAERDEWLESRDILEDAKTEEIMDEQRKSAEKLRENIEIMMMDASESEDGMADEENLYQPTWVVDTSGSGDTAGNGYTTASFGKSKAKTGGGSVTGTAKTSSTRTISRSVARTRSGESFESLEFCGNACKDEDSLSDSLSDIMFLEGKPSWTDSKKNVVFFFVLVVALGLSIGLGLRPTIKEESFDALAEIEAEDLLALLVAKGAVSKDLLQDASTPQGMAFNWLDSTMTEDMPQWKLLQRYALAAFYYSTASSNWIASDKWLTEEDECNWFSRSEKPCDSNGRVISLSLGQNGLSGTLPPDLGILSSLREVNLMGLMGGTEEVLSGSLPESLTSWTHLESLNLMHQQFSGSLPENFFNSWLHLKQLDLNDNRFNGTLPAALGTLLSLEHAHLCDNHFDGEIPYTYDGSPARSLDFHGNQLTGRVPKGRWPNLRHLRISMNKLTTFEDPVQAPHLEKVIASNNAFTGSVPEFSNAPSLEVIKLNGNNFDGQIPETWGDLMAIQTVDVSQNLLSGAVPEQLTSKGDSSLEELRLEGNELSSMSCPASKSIDWSADCSPVNGEREIECECCSNCCQDGALCKSSAGEEV